MTLLEGGTYEPDFDPGQWVAFEEDGDSYKGIVVRHDLTDGEYWVLYCPTDSDHTDPANDQWDSMWLNHSAPKALENMPNAWGGQTRDHVFLVGSVKALTGVQVYADVTTLVASYPNEGEHALEAVADPDEPVGKVRFAIVKGADRG